MWGVEMLYNDIEFIDFRNKHSIFCRRQKFLNKNQHRHAYYEIEISVAGQGRHIINDHEYKICAGDIFLMRLTDSHEFEMECQGENWVIEIPPATIPDEIAKMMVLAEGDIVTHLNEEDFQRAKALYLMIEECNNKNDIISETMKMHLVCSIILFIMERTEKNFAEKCMRKSVSFN